MLFEDHFLLGNYNENEVILIRRIPSPENIFENKIFMIK